jgi:hypothetical protein
LPIVFPPQKLLYTRVIYEISLCGERKVALFQVNILKNMEHKALVKGELSRFLDKKGE